MNYQANVKDITGQNLQFYYYGHEQCKPDHFNGPIIRDNYMLKFATWQRSLSH